MLTLSKEAPFFFKLLPMRMPYLGIFQLARLTPDDIEVKLVDELVENYDYENDPFEPDLAAISASFSANALRAYEVADIYKKRGIPVVMGGVHATFMPEEAKQHADSVCLGEADEIWETILEDAKKGRLQPFYKVQTPPDLLKVRYKRPNPLLNIPSVDPEVLSKIVAGHLNASANGNGTKETGALGRLLNAAGTPLMKKFVKGGFDGLFRVPVAGKLYKKASLSGIKALVRRFEDVLPAICNAPVGGYPLKKVVQVDRGCPTDCDFCSVTAFNGRKMRNFRIDQLLQDIDELAGDGKGADRFFFLADDNIVGNPKFAAEFFEALKGLKISWISQATVQMARNDKLLKLASDSGCCAIFYGFESLQQEAVYGVGKKFKVQEYEDIIKKTHDHGIVLLYGAFIFGLPGDTLDVFDRTVDFCVKNQVEMPQFTFITPLPGTRLWKKHEESGEPLSREWNKYDLLNADVLPPDSEFLRQNNITREQVFNLGLKAYRKMFTDEAIDARLSGAYSQAGFMNLLLYTFNYIGKYIAEKEYSYKEGPLPSTL